MIYNNIKDISKDIKNIILDLDGCIFDSRECNKYIPKNKYDREGWNLFQEQIDKAIPNYELINYILNLIENNNLKNVFFVTARENINNMLDDTLEQIYKAFNIKNLNKVNCYLYMRDAYDYRPSDIVKRDIFNKEIATKCHIEGIDLAIDDEMPNIQMYEQLGIDSLHYTKFII